MRLIRILGAAIACALCLALHPLALHAHHGGAVEWQGDIAGPITGIATEFFFRFPHIFVHLDVQDGDAVTRWTLTSRWTPTILRRHGWTRDSIKPGDTITATYLPHVTDPTVGHMQTIEVNGTALSLSFE